MNSQPELPFGNTRRFALRLLICLLLLTLAGCNQCSNGDASSSDNSASSEESTPNSDDSNDNGNQPPQNLGEAMNQMAKGLEALQGEDAKESIHPKILRDLFPDKLLGLPLDSRSAEKSGIGKVKVSVGKATYKSADGKKRIDATYTDLGAVANAITAYSYAWTMTEIYRESSTGREETKKFGGFPGYVKFENRNNYMRGQANVMVEQRYIAEIKTTGLEDGKQEQCLDELKTTSRLAKLKNAGSE